MNKGDFVSVIELLLVLDLQFMKITISRTWVWKNVMKKIPCNFEICLEIVPYH